MNRWVLLPVVLALLISGGACSRKKPPPEKPKPVAPKKVYEYTKKEETVPETKIVFKKGMDIMADFDGDGQEDMAVIERTPEGRHQVLIYINKALGRYYIGGRIQREAPGAVTGLAVREGREYVDLAVMIRNTNNTIDTIHYQNDGTSFTEIPDPFKKSLSSEK
ncbi:MAG: hypothetical protein JXR37_12675 [Kiritimatiellae bacterium]|nr:hypothetical protein [Kiritimatiellia bacterium]